MSLPREVKDAIHTYGRAVSGGDIAEGIARLEDLQAAIARFFYRPLPNGKLMCEPCARIAAECEAQAAAAVKPWRELVERAVPFTTFYGLGMTASASGREECDQWLNDAKALLEKPCSTS